MPQPAGDGVVIADIGISLSEKTAINYLFEPLLNFRSNENNGLQGEVRSTIESHNDHWTEENMSKRFGAFFFDFTFKMEPDTGRVDFLNP